ncbi:FxsA family protein [Lentzea tibetensis]|uniref:FxsA family protein n=1 Tax=Lentzea tibetensis TaxID=2591470 RepID=A0A563F195_9PSEU|nr:FxsA family protein [Lentzea tibetensis]TWP53673.1 FxsA family protein [Lentzea tibetensis]
MPVFVLLLAGVVAEIAVLIAVGQAIGVLWTLLLLILGTVVGVQLMRREGSRTMVAFTEALRTRRVPHQEMADGVLIAAAGVLIMVPGFVSDVAALFLLFPPTRRLISHRMAIRAEAQALRFEHERRFGATPGVVDGEVVSEEPVVIVEQRRELPPTI